MKIAYFLDVPKGLGGAGNLLLQQAVLMSELYEVIAVIPADEEGNYNYEYAMRCERHHVPYVWMEYNTAYNFDTIDHRRFGKSTAMIEALAVKENITFFHSVQINVAAEYVSRKLKIPHLMNIYQLQEAEFRACPGDIYSHYHLCDSLLYSDLWSRKLGIRSKCIRPIALLDDIKRKDICSKKKIGILMLGNVCLRKNQLTAIKAIEHCIPSNKLELHIAGEIDSEYAEECIAYVKEHKLERFIFFHGFVSDITSLLEKCDCLLCASMDESFPSSIVEALTYDLTIISTPVAGVPELFADNYNAFLSKDFSEESLRESILECLRQYKNGKIKAIHKNAEKTWNENFARNIVRDQIDLYYKDIETESFNGNIDEFIVLEKNAKKMEEMLHDMNDEGERWIYGRMVYYSLLSKRLHGGKIYIWGAGKLGKIAFEILTRICPHLEVVAFIDKCKEGVYCGIPIIEPDNVKIEKTDFYIIGFSRAKEGAIRYLEERGLELNIQIWCMP